MNRDYYEALQTEAAIRIVGYFVVCLSVCPFVCLYRRGRPKPFYLVSAETESLLTSRHWKRNWKRNWAYNSTETETSDFVVKINP